MSVFVDGSVLRPSGRATIVAQPIQRLAEEADAALDRGLGQGREAEDQAGSAAAGVAVQAESLDADAQLCGAGDQGGLVGALGQHHQLVEAGRSGARLGSGQPACDRIEQGVAAALVAQAGAAKMAVELPPFDEVAEGELADDLVPPVLDRLRGRQLPGEPGWHQRPAEPQARGEALARRADVGDPLRRQSLEGADAGAVVAVLGVEVVLDDQGFVPLRPLDQRRAALAAEHATGRELVRRRDDDGPGAAALEQVDPQPFAVDRHRHHLEAGLLDDQPLPVPARILERDPLDAAFVQPAAEGGEGLGEAAVDMDLFGIGRGATGASQVTGERLAELPGAPRVGIADRAELRLSQRHPQGTQPAVAGEARQVGLAGIEVEAEAGGWLRRRRRLCGADGSGDAHRGALAGQQIALGRELPVRLGNHAAGHPELRRQRSGRRELRLSRQAPASDSVPDRALDLFMQGRRAATVDREQESGSANWSFQLSHYWHCISGQFSPTVTFVDRITVIGGGLGGLTAAIACAEEGAQVVLLEAHDELGGRGRSTRGPYKANLGPHVIYKDGRFWDWLEERDLMPPVAGLPLGGLRFRWQGASRRVPPLGTIPSVLRLRGRTAPVDQDFRSWAASLTDERTAEMMSAAAGVYTFHHDPGELSAAFVWGHTVRVLLSPPPTARYVIGGWGALISALEARARQLGVQFETGSRVDDLPGEPVIVATELNQARELLDDPSLEWPSGHALCLDLGFARRRGDPFVVSDLDEAGWVERFSAPDPSLAPDGESLVQAQIPIRPDESPDRAALRLEALLDVSIPDWRERETWRRRQVMHGRTGALDLPGKTWRDRPAVSRGGGVFLVGDMVAAPGLLSEVSISSAIEASGLALAAAGHRRAEVPDTVQIPFA